MRVIENFIEGTKFNSILTWILIGVLGFSSTTAFLSGNLVFSIFSGFIVLIALLPSIAFRKAKATPPWEIVLIAAAPFIIESWIADIPSRYFSYISTSAVAMMIAAELHFFTEVKMNDFFAVFFVTVTTVASAGAWSIVRWLSNIYFGTNFLPTENLLMWEFTLATFSGITAGIFYDIYFKHFLSQDMYEEVIE